MNNKTEDEVALVVVKLSNIVSQVGIIRLVTLVILLLAAVIRIYCAARSGLMWRRMIGYYVCLAMTSLSVTFFYHMFLSHMHDNEKDVRDKSDWDQTLELMDVIYFLGFVAIMDHCYIRCRDLDSDVVPLHPHLAAMRGLGIPLTPRHKITVNAFDSLTEMGLDSQVTECTICKETITHPAILMPCKHPFDYKCVMQWLKPTTGSGHNRCPNCRTLVQSVSHTKVTAGPDAVTEIVVQ